MRRIGMLSIALAVVAASCGGATSDDATTTSPATEPETAVTTTSAAPTTTAAVAPTTTAAVATAAGDTEFCDLIAAQDTASETMDIFDPASVEKSIKDSLDAIRLARDLVPSDIRGAYDTIASAFEGLVVALEESGWDMLAIVNDPRILRMESPEVLGAAAALNDYCGLDADGNDGEAGAQSPDAGAGSDTGLPDDLVAPGAVLLRDAAGIKIFTSTASFDETVSYYEGIFGEAPLNVSGSAGARVASFLSATPVDVLVQVEEGGGELLIYITLTG
ncbi:MAG: hypothetical protein ACE1Z9_02405 [Acidimicrobiia bacterium]